MKSTIKVGVSGVRGVVGESFSPQLSASFAEAFGSFVGVGPVVVGRDTRPSGPMIENAVIAGLLSVGCSPILAGIVPTPTVLYLTRALGARGGVAITASHNPEEWNAFKFADRSGMFLSPIHAEELFDIYHQGDFPLVQESRLRRVTRLEDPTRQHFEAVTSYVDADLIRKKRFKVALDCCNGVGALHTRAFLEGALRCEVVSVFDEPTGLFEREPEPLPENLVRLCEAMKAERCHVGFAQDPDGDRLAIIDEQGVPIGEALSVGLAIQQVLEHHEQGPVVVNMSMAQSVKQVARELGQEVTLTETGEVHVSRKMLEIGSVVGGEHTGGVIIPGIHPCRDSYGGMAVVLERMAMTGASPSVLRDAFPQVFTYKNKLPIRSDQAPSILRAVRRRYEQENMNLLDGVYVDFGDQWIHVRHSNTEPVIRIFAEAPHREQATQLGEELETFIRGLL